MNADHRDRLSSLFPSLERTEATLALSVYRMLVQGRPVDTGSLARGAGIPESQLRAILDGWPAVFRDDAGRIIGFWGLALSAMRHRFEVGGRELFTWCAWDALFIPPLLGATARVVSPSGLDERVLTLTVTPTGVTVDPTLNEPVFVSFRLPQTEEWTADVLSTFCHHVYFLLGDEAERWKRAQGDSFILPIDDAFAVGQHKNAVQFGDCVDESLPVA